MVAIFPLAPTQLIGEKRVTLQGLTWQAYQQILHALPHSRATRLTYDRGLLEITIPLEDHEFALRLIERFVIILVFEMGMKIKTMGSTTMDREELDRGSEPDCAYYIQNQPKVAGRKVDFATDPPPDLVLDFGLTKRVNLKKDQQNRAQPTISAEASASRSFEINVKLLTFQTLTVFPRRI